MLGPIALAALLAAPAFWDRVADPHRAQVEALIARARGELLSGSKDGPARAEHTLREALRFDPTSFTATMLLGEAQVGEGQRAAAAVAFGRARALARTP